MIAPRRPGRQFKPKPQGGGGRQDLSGAKDGTITGAHGGIQQLGAAAKRRLGGQPAASKPSVPISAVPPKNPGMDFNGANIMEQAGMKGPAAGFAKPQFLGGAEGQVFDSGGLPAPGGEGGMGDYLNGPPPQFMDAMAKIRGQMESGNLQPPSEEQMEPWGTQPGSPSVSGATGNVAGQVGGAPPPPGGLPTKPGRLPGTGGIAAQPPTPAAKPMTGGGGQGQRIQNLLKRGNGPLY